MDISVRLRNLLVFIQYLAVFIGVCLCIPEIRIREPEFQLGPSKVTYRSGETARLFCSVKYLGERTVIWRKMTERNPLTIGDTTWISDSRFSVDNEGPHWDLIIDDVRPRDAGDYECQISISTKLLRHVVELIVPDSSSGQSKRNPEILITGTQFVTSGETVNLYCNASILGNPRRALIWLKESTEMMEESERHTIAYVPPINRESLSSHLVIKPARPSDSGLYTCKSKDNKLSTSAQVNVLTAGSNNVKRAGSVSQESSAVLSVQCAISHLVFVVAMAIVHVVLT